MSGGDDGTVRVWDLATGGALGKPLTGNDGPVYSVAVGRIGGQDVMVSGGQDGTVRVWDLATGRSMGGPLTGHDHAINTVEVARVAGQDVVMSGGNDATLRLWVMEVEGWSCREIIDLLAPVADAQIGREVLVAATGRALCAFSARA